MFRQLQKKLANLHLRPPGRRSFESARPAQSIGREPHKTRQHLLSRESRGNLAAELLVSVVEDCQPLQALENHKCDQARFPPTNGKRAVFDPPFNYLGHDSNEPADVGLDRVDYRFVKALWPEPDKELAQEPRASV